MQRVPIVGGIAVIQHPLEDLIGIRFGAVGPQAVFVVHPGEDDDLAGAAVAEKEPETTIAELGAKPVLAVIAKSRALPIDGCCRVRWHIDGDELDQGRKQLGVGGFLIIVRFLRLERVDRLDQLFPLIEKERVCV